MTSCTVLAFYLLVSSAANLFHTEFNREDRLHSYASANSGGIANPSYPSNPSDESYTDSRTQQHSPAIRGLCPVCVFQKTHHSQVFSDSFLILPTVPLSWPDDAAETVLLPNCPFSTFQTRAPPVCAL